ncbi:hypothetical protein [Sphingobium ummariense]|uniref:hypothetical protein n=1 Tax=Sphingobium ummariense TaxID=420994 RepID=UPI001267CCD9|nr:hypothetical protein [Sphingobium ummariense]
MKRRLYIDFDRGQRVDGVASAVMRGGNAFNYKATIDPGTQAKDRPAVVSEGCKSPPGCLRVSLDPSKPGAAKNKIMFPFWSHKRPLPGGESGRLRIGDGRTTKISFDMKLDRNYDTPLHALLHFQIFQPQSVAKTGAGNRPGGPVIALNIVPRSKRRNLSPDIQEFVIAIRNPDAQKFVWFDTRDNTVLYRGAIQKGAWNTYTFQITSSPLRDGGMGGRVIFLMNKQKKVDKVVHWGFSPKNYNVLDTMSIELGAYRTPDKSGHQTVFFDNLLIER